MQVVHATLQDALPSRVAVAQVIPAKRRQDVARGLAVERRLERVGADVRQLQEPGGGDGRGGSVEQLAAFRGGVEIPGGHAVGRAVLNVEIGAGHGGLEEPRVAGIAVAGPEPVQRPGEPAGPAGIPAIPLVGRLLQELARLEIEKALVGGGAVAADQHPAGGQGVAHGDIHQARVARLGGRIKNDAHVHHDVDEERILRDEGPQVLAFLLETERHGAARLHDDVLQRALAGQPVPAVVGGHEDEAEVVDVAVHLSRFEGAGIADGLLPPVAAPGAVGGLASGEDPHHAGEEPVAPVCPGFAFVLPAPLAGVHGVEIGVAFDQCPDLLPGEREGIFEESGIVGL